jgi:peptide/nickel transport system ATP-binding protein
LTKSNLSSKPKNETKDKVESDFWGSYKNRKRVWQVVIVTLAFALFGFGSAYLILSISSANTNNIGSSNAVADTGSRPQTGGAATTNIPSGSATGGPSITGNSPSTSQPSSSNTNQNGNGNTNTRPQSDKGGSGQFQINYFLVALVLIALSLIVWISVRVRMKQKPPSDVDPNKFPSSDSEGLDHFSLNKIGGPPSPYLDQSTLDGLAKSLNYFLSEKSCKRLDTKASVHASGRNAGMYTPHFYKLKILLSVYILEDAYAEPSAWNSVAGELAAGLRQRGVNVRFGSFYDSLENFQMEDGGTLWFEELEYHRHESLIFIFSDGKRLTRRRDGFLLEALARWSTVAWLDLREKKFWDESAQLIKHFNIPLYQANKDGIARAMNRFVTEHGSERDDAAQAAYWQGVRANKDLPLDEYIRALVGEEAIAWAQACSMIQPLSLGMADALRRECARHLFPEQVERLFRLPKTEWYASGLHFSLPVVSALHSGFTETWSMREQEKILEFIIEKIEKEEPPEKKSRRHLIWQWTLERVRMEVDPDAALESLAKLSETPLGDRIRYDFSYISLPDERTHASANALREGVFLRLRPKTVRGLLRFQYLSGREIRFSRLGFIKWLLMLWYKTQQALEAVLSIQFTFNKTTEKLALSKDISPQISRASIYAIVNEGIIGGSTNILKVKNLNTHFPSEDGTIKAVDDVSFELGAGELLGLVGESGCGKSITAHSIMRLVSPPGKIVGGEVWLKGENILEVNEKRMREVRGNNIVMIFQDPMTSLNPFHTVGKQIAEALRLHRDLNRRQAYEASIEAMREVAIPDPETRVDDYPHQFSGGMRQRIMIAMALACDPEILIADEPTTALDLITQAQILDLLNSLRQTRKLAILLITHDLSLVAGVANRVCVMYAGRVVEEASAREIFKYPRHPYTQGLLNSMPVLNTGRGKAGSLSTIEGTVPNPTDLPPGCHFAPRCVHRLERCTQEPMPLYQVGKRAEVRCVLYELQNVRGG